MGETIPLIQAKHCGPARPGKILDLVVMHTMQAPEKPGTARAVANWFAGESAPKASAHFCVDSIETIQCVKEDVVAWAAPGANNNGVHIELAGYAAQSAPQWDDVYSRAMLERAAKVSADTCLRNQIPIRRLTVEDLKAGGARGFCGHIDVSKAFLKSDHTDPGGSFPWDHYLDLVRAALPQPEDVALDDETRQRVMALVQQTAEQIGADDFAGRLNQPDDDTFKES